MIVLSLTLDLPKYLEPGRLPLELAGIALVMKVLVEGRASAVQRVLDWGPVEFVGRLSYSLYLWQQVFFPKKPLLAWQHLPWNLLLALAAAAASYYLLEQPALRWRERFLRRNRKSAPSDTRA
jgi:peptidoglycan/LPS O-acetylase OafA/YrhL